ncbi:hypothetical protein BCR35DRAFT_305580 [Leucosporidium creatinivorum]|uniref:Cytoplasmic protein n=1 Tax=Leucosporidium creatinivorum TaxID=106004 RepID=A0A1Y2F0B0_9BASI|nr:hypothetical protein BCR35DRAFT_305580 [Leucosporidium creatinivorum]
MSSALTQLHESIQAGDHYSAHQKARTTATRLLAPPRRGPAPTTNDKGFLPFDPKAQEAATLLYEGATALLEKGQTGSGVDLAGFLCDVWKARGVQCGSEERAKIIKLIALTGPSGSWRKTLTDQVFAWSAKTGSGATGDVGVHEYLGQVLYKEQSYHLATIHLLTCPTSEAARTLADVLFDWSKLDPEGEKGVGRYAARGVLSYLESTSILSARVFLSHFLSHTLTAYPTLRVVSFPYPPPSSPLASTLTSTDSDELVVTKLASLNFLQLAVRTCQLGAGEKVEKGEKGEVVKGGGRRAYEALVKRYEKEVKWMRSPEAKESTAELGTLYFGIKPPRGAGNPFADMLSGMFGGGAGGAPAIAGR